MIHFFNNFLSVRGTASDKGLVTLRIKQKKKQIAQPSEMELGVEVTAVSTEDLS